MTQMSTQSLGTRRGAASNNVYTVLMLVALLALCVGIGYTWYRSTVLFGSGNPVAITPANPSPTR